MPTLQRAAIGIAAVLLLGAPINGALSADAGTDDLGFGGETLAELSVPSWALPDDLAALVVGDWTLAAGTDVTGERHTSEANESMRNVAIMVTSGQFLIEPTVDALLWRDPRTMPSMSAAFEPVTLRTGEAIYLPAISADEVDPTQYLRIANPGSVDATAWMAHVHQASSPVFGGLPPGLRFDAWQGRQVPILNPSEWLAAETIHFRLARHTGPPGFTYVAPRSPASGAFFVESGVAERIMSGPGAELTSRFSTGTGGDLMAAEALEQTLTVTGDGPAAMLVLTAIPQPPVD
jgi:hypothetical protein